MNHIKEDIYLRARRNRIKLYFRLCLGLRQLIYRPYNNVVPLLLALLFAELWKYKEVLFPLKAVPLPLIPIFQHTFSLAVVLIPITFLMGFLKFLGNMTARRDETDLIIAFTEKDLRNGHPLLISREKIKGTNVTIREFFSNIPMKTWADRKAELADQMNVHFVEPCIEYGGKRNDNGNRIRLYTAPGRKRPERGNLYDNEL